MSTPPPLHPDTPRPLGRRWIVIGSIVGSIAVASLAWIFWPRPLPQDDFVSPKPQLKANPVRTQLAEADLEYYADVSRMAVSPTAVMSVEAELVQEIGSGDLLERYPFYAGFMGLAAQKIAERKRHEVDRRLVRAASELRLRRLDEAQLMAQIQAPDLKGAGARLFVDFLVSLVPDEKGQAKSADAAFQTTLAKGLAGAADSIKSMTAAAQAVQGHEMAIMDIHAKLLREIPAEESLGLPSFQDSLMSVVQRMDKAAREKAPLLDMNALKSCLVGRKSIKMDFEFEEGEIRELLILSQETRGHCIVSKIRVSVVSSFLGERKTAEIRLVHSAMPDGVPQLLFVE